MDTVSRHQHTRHGGFNGIVNKDTSSATTIGNMMNPSCPDLHQIDTLNLTCPGQVISTSCSNQPPCPSKQASPNASPQLPHRRLDVGKPSAQSSPNASPQLPHRRLDISKPFGTESKGKTIQNPMMSGLLEAMHDIINQVKMEHQEEIAKMKLLFGNKLSSIEQKLMENMSMMLQTPPENRLCAAEPNRQETAAMKANFENRLLFIEASLNDNYVKMGHQEEITKMKLSIDSCLSSIEQKLMESMTMQTKSESRLCDVEQNLQASSAMKANFESRLTSIERNHNDNQLRMEHQEEISKMKLLFGNKLSSIEQKLVENMSMMLQTTPGSRLCNVEQNPQETAATKANFETRLSLIEESLSSNHLRMEFQEELEKIKLSTDSKLSSIEQKLMESVLTQTKSESRLCDVEQDQRASSAMKANFESRLSSIEASFNDNHHMKMEHQEEIAKMRLSFDSKLMSIEQKIMESMMTQTKSESRLCDVELNQQKTTAMKANLECRLSSIEGDLNSTCTSLSHVCDLVREHNDGAKVHASHENRLLDLEALTRQILFLHESVHQHGVEQTKDMALSKALLEDNSAIVKGNV